MKKKIVSISLLTILIATLSLTMTSCFEHHLRPSGVYSTYEYKDEAKGKTYRILVNFIQENLDDKKRSIRSCSICKTGKERRWNMENY